MLVKIFEKNTNFKDVRKVVDVLSGGGLAIYPTDTVYALGCDMMSSKAAERLAQFKNIKLKDADFSFICHDISNMSFFSKNIDNTTFKLLKRNLPGPFTFILEASSNVPKYFRGQKKTIGIRVPDNNIILEIVKALGNPILTTSVHDDDDVIEYTTDPELVHEKYKKIADIVVDGGFGKNIASTVVDCTGDEPVILRQGAGELLY